MRPVYVALTLVFFLGGVAGAMQHDRGISRVTVTSGVAQTVSRQCGACHSLEFSLWVRHPHSHFLIDPSRDSRLIRARWGWRVPGWQEYVVDRFERKDVALAFGVLEIQVYFRRSSDGHRLMPAQWNLRERRWEPLPAELEEVWRAGKTWEQKCAGCHTTGFDPDDGSFLEANAACGACHGDGEAHGESGGLEPILRPSNLDARRLSEICGACHSKGRDRKSRRPYPVGFVPGSRLDDVFQLEAPVPGVSTRYFWSDGTERQPFMEYQGFIQSRHYEAGLACTTCHLPHGSHHSRSLRRKTADLCRGCHTEVSSATPVHRSHPPDEATCVDCHMSYANPEPNRLHFRTHTLRFLEPSLAVGTDKPTSCTVACHAGRDAGWAAEVLETWRAP